MTKSTDKHDTTALSNELMISNIKYIKANAKCVECCFIDMIVTMMINLLAYNATKEGKNGVSTTDLVTLAAYVTTSCQEIMESQEVEMHVVNTNDHMH